MRSLYHLSKQWLGVPFRWHGRTKLGCDCVGLVIGILHENNIINEKDMNELKNIKYGTNLSQVKKNVLMLYLLRYFCEVDDIKFADLLLVKTKNSPIHFVIFEKGKMAKMAKIIHITQEVGCVFETNFSSSAEWQIIKMFALH